MTAGTLAAHVHAALLPFRVEGLIAPASRERIAEVAALIPAAASAFFGFEVRLGETAPEADFLACIHAEGDRHAAWAAALPPAGREDDPVWQRLATFVRIWADAGSAYHRPIANMWAEFDLAGQTTPEPRPSVFFGTDVVGAAEADPHAHAWLRAAITDLRGAPLSDAGRALLAGCLAALPAEGGLFQIGMMLSRAEPVLRLCLRGVAPRAIPAYLAAIGWPGPQPALEALIAEVAPLTDRILINLDMSDTMHGKLGLECYLDHDADLRTRLPTFLGYLRERGLCTDVKANALAAWYGLTHERWCRDAWPADLRDHAGRPDSRHSGGFMRTLHHVKLVFDPPRPLQAKAYLASRFGWVDNAALKRLLVQGI